MRIALGIPHRPDLPDRVRSLKDLLASLEVPEGALLTIPRRVFDEKKPNRAWARDLWQWGRDEGADFFLTLQDDVRVAPRFWGALCAMLAHLPSGTLLGLGAQHPDIDSTMRPWVRTRAWVLGWGYGIWPEDLAALCEYDLSGADGQWTEDTFVNEWAKKSGRDVWHPVPTIVQHRTELKSTYSNWPRPATCDWTALSEEGQTELCDPAAWAPRKDMRDLEVTGRVAAAYERQPYRMMLGKPTRRASLIRGN